MPTLAINSILTYSTSKARTQVNSFDRSLSVQGMTSKQLILGSGMSGSISLTSSSYLIVLCNEDCLTIALSNTSNQVISFFNCGFLSIVANNLNSVTITNTDTHSKELTIYF